jgi:hypothetical protein
MIGALRQLAGAARRHGLAAGALQLGLGALRKVLTLERTHLFRLRRPPLLKEMRTTRCATIDDLLPMLADPSWDLEDATPAGIERLFDRGHRCVLNIVQGRPAGYAWMNPNRIVIPCVEATFSLQPGELHIYKGFTHRAFRGCRLGLDRFAHWFTEAPTSCPPVLVTDFAFDNAATMTRVEPLGLERIGSATLVRVGEFRRRRFSGALRDRHIGDIPADLPHRDH